MKHIFFQKIELGVYYTYDENNKKVYDLKNLQEDFKSLTSKLNF